MSEDKINFHIGGLDDMGRRFIDAWHAAEEGKPVERDNVTFLTLKTFVAAVLGRLTKGETLFRETCQLRPDFPYRNWSTPPNCTATLKPYVDPIGL